MKRSSIMVVIVFVLTLILPVSAATLSVFGFELFLRHELVLAFVNTVTFSGLSVHLLKHTEWKEDKAPVILFTVMLPLAVCDLYLSMWMSKSIIVTLLAVLRVILSAVLMLTGSARRVLKVICTIISATMLLLFAVVAVMFFTFGQIGYKTTVNICVSPEGTHRAEVIDCNQGALGGDTVVEVYDERCRLDLYFIEIYKAPEMVYLGEWGEFKDMEVYWESEQVLIINGLKHVVR
ncbi:MAG: hypothetical protein IJZ85_12030 [Lachnospiraceae bacterium]|nr:hypothetical protein [Lachnospiraceae bacterium]